MHEFMILLIGISFWDMHCGRAHHHISILEWRITRFVISSNVQDIWRLWVVQQYFAYMLMSVVVLPSSNFHTLLYKYLTLTIQKISNSRIFLILIKLCKIFKVRYIFWMVRVRYFVKKNVKFATWQHYNTHEHLQIEVLPMLIWIEDLF